MKAGGRQVRIALVSDGLLEELIDRLEEHILLQYLGLGITPFGDILVHAAVADKLIPIVQNGYGIGLQADQTAVLAQVPVHQIHEGLFIRHQLAVDLADTSGFMPGHEVEWRFPEYLGAFVSQDLFHLARGKSVDAVLVDLPDPVRRAHGDVLKPLLGVFQLVQDLLLARYIPVDSEDHLEYTSHEDGRSDDGNGDFPAVLAPADGFEGDLLSADNLLCDREGGLHLVWRNDQIIKGATDDFLGGKPEHHLEFAIDPENPAVFVGDDNSLHGVLDQVFEPGLFLEEAVLRVVPISGWAGCLVVFGLVFSLVHIQSLRL